MRFIVPSHASSWVAVSPESHFPIQNLPMLLFVPRDTPNASARLGTRIGNQVLDITGLVESGELAVAPDSTAPLLLPSERMGEVRRFCFELLEASNPWLQGDSTRQERLLRPVDSVVPQRIRHIGAFVDFYSGINHASNVGRMFRPDQPPLLPNYRHLPVGYNGRASTVVLSDTPIRRPNGQQKIGEEVVFGPSRELDFELEMGFFLGEGSAMGRAVPIERCEDLILGFVLVNDWSARDVQRWEYQPLGPFLAKSFATSISSYLVMPDALDPFRVPGPTQEPEPLPHLKQAGLGQYDIHLEVQIQTARMTKPQTITRSNSRELYWSFAQQLAHQSSNGTQLEAGDLYASGTISGTEPDSFGSLLELTWRGTKPLTMEETGETRTFLEDGDSVIMSGWCQGDGYRVGFGALRGVIEPAIREN